MAGFCANFFLTGPEFIMREQNLMRKKFLHILTLCKLFLFEQALREYLIVLVRYMLRYAGICFATQPIERYLLRVDI